MIRKVLFCLGMLVAASAANAQEMMCNFDGNYPWTPINEPAPADCINNFLWSESKYMVAIGHAPPYCSPFFDTTPGKLLWSNNGDQGIWQLYVNAFVGPDILDRPICVSTSRQYPMGQTVNSYSTEPPLPNWTASASANTLPGVIEINGPPAVSYIVGSSTGTNFTLSIPFIPLSSYTTYGIGINGPMDSLAANTWYKWASISNVQLKDSNGNVVSVPTWAHGTTTQGSVTLDDWCGCGGITGLTDGNLYYIVVTGVATYKYQSTLNPPTSLVPVEATVWAQ